MAQGFGYGVRRSQAPHYGNDFYYNDGNFNGLGDGENVYSEPMQVQYQMYSNKPYGVSNYGNGSSWGQVGSNHRVQVGPNYPNPSPNPYYKNMTTSPQTIQGNIVQRGVFNGRCKGARIHGDFFVSGDIN